MRAWRMHVCARCSEYRDEMGLEGDVVGTYKELMTRALDAPEPVASIDATTTSELTVEKDAVGIELVEFIATEDYKPNAAFKDTECAVFVSPRLKRIVVAFRGTESRVDWLGNLRATQRDIGDSSDNIDSEVHSGFRAAYFDGKVAERVEAAVVEQYEKHSKNGLLEDWGILTTGHSLGGALATLCLYRLAVRNVGGLAGKGVPIEMVNFGAPRVGNAAFCSELEASSAAVARVVNLRDAVCRIAPAWLTSYRHAGPFTKFDGEGQATVYSADEQRELGWGFSSDDHSMSTTDKNGNAYLNKLMALGQSGWPGRASA